MSNKPVNEMALGVGGILAGWEIDPGWTPLPGDTITVSFAPQEGRSGQVPATTTVSLSPFYILAAQAMRAGGQGLNSTLQSAKKKAENWGGGGKGAK